ncbi:serine/threonine-protein phosphatase 7 long form homolog [Apium graveolens]|uniref:serine/threonine-protein phosphatase 7 long form homolog n=1 Tax=Apium graveolens TaxID=4045 RepID=UPI003D7BA9AF
MYDVKLDVSMMEYMAQQESIHPGPIDRCLLTRQDEHRSQLVWDGKITRGHLRLRSNFKSYWDKVARFPPPSAVIEGIRNAGFFGVYHTATMKHDAGLITAFVDRWRPETHTFHLRFGEATVTVEDVYYILGLHSTGRPVILAGEVANTALVHELLGVAPDSETVIAKGLLHIPWLVDHFGTCDRLKEATGDVYEIELLYHIRAHLLLIIGSLFPNSSGNRIPIRLLPYLRDLDEVRTYSWGSACLAFLYSRLCSASIGDVAELSGSMTLLQVWIYEHCTGLAPRQRDHHIMQHPRALRWMVPLNAVDVPTHSVRGARYELDFMNEASFKWRPYLDSAPDAMMIPDHDLALMTAPCPLIYMETVEWCYTDRVTRQFGFLQTITTTSPHPGHCSFHGRRKHWHFTLERVIDIWESREEHIMAAPKYHPIVLPACVDQYLSWYNRVTRRLIIKPRIWRQEESFQGSQGHLPMAVSFLLFNFHIVLHYTFYCHYMRS